MITFRSQAAPAAVASGNLTFTEPSGAAEGDLLVVVIAYRSTATFTAPSGWEILQQQSSGNTSTTTATSIGSGLIAWTIRGSSAPSLTFTRTAGDVAQGRIAAYKGVHRGNPVISSTSATLGANSTTVSVGGLTGIPQGALMVIGACGADNGTCSAYQCGTDPVANQFIERADTNTATGADTTNALADAIKTVEGDTGTIQYTASLSSRHVIVAAAFRSATNVHRIHMGQFESASTAEGANFITPSFTPPANSTLVVMLGSDKAGADVDNNADVTGNQTITDSAGLTWTKRATGAGAAQTGGECHIWTAPVGSSPASMTITFNHGATNTISLYSALVLAYRGAQYRQAASFEPTGTGVNNATFGSTPKVDSDVMAMICDGGGVTPSVTGTQVISFRNNVLGAANTVLNVQRDGQATTTIGFSLGSFTTGFASIAAIEMEPTPSLPPLAVNDSLLTQMLPNW
jgi:hypothetical protein